MKLRLAAPEQLVDLRNVRELGGLRHEAETLTIGAMTRHADVAEDATVAGAIPALARLASGIGDKQVTDMEKLGGSVANHVDRKRIATGQDGSRRVVTGWRGVTKKKKQI